MRCIRLIGLCATWIVLVGCGGSEGNGGGGNGGPGIGPVPVVLGRAGTFAILSKAGISTVPNSVVVGDIGVSPISGNAFTGFSLAMDASNTFATSTQVIGRLLAANYAAPTPDELTTAITDMETAFIDAAGRALPVATELGGGEIGGLTLAPGLYKWGTGVSISVDVTLMGGANDRWIFQIAGGLTMASAKRVILVGGARAENVFWQVFGAVEIGVSAQFSGVLICQTNISVRTGAAVLGRLLAQTGITLDQCSVTAPSE